MRRVHRSVGRTLDGFHSLQQANHLVVRSIITSKAENVSLLVHDHRKRLGPATVDAKYVSHVIRSGVRLTTSAGESANAAIAYPFTPVAAMPWTKYLWSARKAATTGTLTTMEAAISWFQ